MVKNAPWKIYNLVHFMPIFFLYFTVFSYNFNEKLRTNSYNLIEITSYNNSGLPDRTLIYYVGSCFFFVSIYILWSNIANLYT